MALRPAFSARGADCHTDRRPDRGRRCAAALQQDPERQRHRAARIAVRFRLGSERPSGTARGPSWMTSMDDLATVGQWTAAMLRSSTPLLLVTLGETLTQRVGIINLGVEGQMLGGACAG